MDVKFGRPEENRGKALDMIRNCPENSLVVLPELFLTGYHRGTIEQTAFTGDSGEWIDWLCEVSDEQNLEIYGSLAEREEGRLYNTAVLISGGKIQRRYRKSHLFGPMGEDEIFTPGREVVVGETGRGDKVTTGMSICYDLRFPELFRQMRWRGAEIMIISAEWPVTRIAHWDLLIRARAIENQVYVIAVNRVGEDPDYKYGGHSQVVDPFGEVVLKMGETEEMTTGRIDLGRVMEFRGIFDTEDDRWIDV